MKDLKWWQWILLIIIIGAVINGIVTLVVLKKAKNVDEIKDIYGVSDKDELIDEILD